MGRIKTIKQRVQEENDGQPIPAEVYEEAIIEEARQILMNQAECND